MLLKLYNKSKIWFALTFIIAYCVLMSIGDSLSELIGIEKSITLAVGIILSGILLFFLFKNNLLKEYGLCRPKTPARSVLFYTPIVIMLTSNLWYGVTLNYGALETVLYVLSMICVGFLEEVIFRGFLFKAMADENTKAAVIVSSVTFGIGHIINLVNGSGAEIIPNLLQILYASAAGFMFVMIYIKTNSLLVCIATHGIFNALSAFANECKATTEMKITTAIFLTLITGLYALYISLSMKRNRKGTGINDNF